MKHAAIAEVDPNITSLVIDDYAAQAPEAGLFTLEQFRGDRLPVCPDSNCRNRTQSEKNREKDPRHGPFLE